MTKGRSGAGHGKRVARHYFVSGRVQGVGYRYFTVKVGRELGLDGWVRNLGDGRVEAYAAGAPDLLSDFEGRLHMGPFASEVRGVEAETAPVDGKLVGFHIR